MLTITISDPITGKDHTAESFADFNRIMWNLRRRSMGGGTQDETQLHLIGKALDAIHAGDTHTVQQLEQVLGVEFDWEPQPETITEWAARVRYVDGRHKGLFPAENRDEARKLLDSGIQQYSWTHAAVVKRQVSDWQVVESI